MPSSLKLPMSALEEKPLGAGDGSDDGDLHVSPAAWSFLRSLRAVFEPILQLAPAGDPELVGFQLLCASADGRRFGAFAAEAESLGVHQEFGLALVTG